MQRYANLSWFALMLLNVMACGEDAKQIAIISHVTGGNTLELTEVEVNRFSDVERVRGPAALFQGNATLDLTVNVALKDKGGNRVDVITKQSAVHAKYIVNNGVAYASDYDSLMMFTAYAHLDAADQFFRELGFDLSIPPAHVYVHPNVRVPFGAMFPESDNAAYTGILDAFLFLPPLYLRNYLPFALNKGVLVHEFSHRIFYYTFWGAEEMALVNAAFVDDELPLAFNRIRALDEGLADFYAAIATDNPQFMERSVFDEMAVERDLSLNRTFSAIWVNGDEPVDVDFGEYDPYAPGSVIAGTLWQLGNVLGRSDVARLALGSQKTVGDDLRHSWTFEFGDFFMQLLSDMSIEQRQEACPIITTNLAAVSHKFLGMCP